MATRPIIATPRGEYDARSLVLSDQAQVSPWPDLSPAGNDLIASGGFAAYQAAGGVGTPWSDTLPAVRMDDVPGPKDIFNLTANFGTSGTPLTLFVVAEATRLDPDTGGGGMCFWGTSDGINPIVGVYLFISHDGSVWFSLGADGGTTGSNTRSAPGVVKPGDRVIITARREEFPNSPGVSAGPTIIRVNGEEVASDLSSGWVDFWFSPKMHRANLPTTGIFPGAIDGEDGLYAHLLAFGSAASDAEILQMEAYLAEIWGFNFGTNWIPEPRPILTETVEGPAPKPTDLFRPIVEFDVRKIRSDGMDYVDEENIRGDEGGVGWQDLEITDPQGRTDAGILPGFGAGNVLFVKNGWNLKRQIDAVRFVGEPPGAPVLQQTSIAWNGGGNDPMDTHWPGNEYTYIGVMRCTDISQHACLFGGTSGIIPVIGNPFKTSVWVQPDGSVAMHHMDEESFGSSVQPGSSYSLESAPGLVKAGDSVIITVTHSTTSGATMRLNGKQIARNTSATRLLEEMNRPSLGESQPQQAGPGVGVVGGLDRLIVYFAAFGGLLTTQQIAEYEKFLAFTFQISIGTEWTFEPPPIIVAGDTPWTAVVDPPLQPVIAEQRIQVDSRGPEPLPLVENPIGSGFFGTWPDGSGSTVPGAVTISGTGTPRPTWEEKGWDPNGRALGVVDFSTLSTHMNINDGGLGLGYNAGPQGDPQGRRVTLFFVVEATDLTQGHIVLIGGNDNRIRRNVLVAILDDGRVAFDYNDSGGVDNTRSAPGVVAEGDRLQITCRAGDGGRIIRVNGVEVASSIGTGTLITYPTMFIGNYRFFQGSPMKLAWYSGHNIEVSDTQILEMEAFLTGAFFTAPPPPPTGWAP